jgi:membrane-anchored protein YejM (alkaline phosphatase superfamily)
VSIPPSLPRAARLRVAARLWLAHIALLAWLCGSYLDSAQPTTTASWLFVHLGRLSCAASLSLAPGLLTLLAALWLQRRHLLAASASLLWTLVALALWIDTRIWGFFRYHFNGLVWNVLTTPGADEAFQLAPGEKLVPLAASVLLCALSWLLYLRLWRSEVARAPAAAPRPFWRRTRAVFVLVLVPVMVLVAGLYARADLVRDPHVMAFARLYPLYPRLTVKRLARSVFGLELKERATVDLPAEGILLAYPRAPVLLPPDGPTPNMLVIVIDSLRADMLTSEVMPQASALVPEARTFADHLSGGNATRFGLFGMLYGLHGSYWKSIYDEKRSPVLVDALVARGYEVRALTSASWDFPEFRSTAWVRVEECAEDRLVSAREGARDDGVAARFEEWLGERDAARPFFAFLLLDAPHQRYWFPPESARFRPFPDEVEYMRIKDDAPPELREGLYNRYRNAVAYADEVLGRLLAALAGSGELASTVLVVTGDHGEEFFEHGFWGHTSNFTAAQAQVPLLLRGPGIAPGVERRPTSHIDLPATLLELAGADPARRADWTLGASLLDPPAERARVVAGWDTLGLHTGGFILEVPMAGYEGMGIAVYDAQWKRVLADEEVLDRSGKVMLDLALECRKFLR